MNLPIWARVLGVIAALLLAGEVIIVLNGISIFVITRQSASLWFCPRDFKCPTCGHNHEPFAPHGPMNDNPSVPPDGQLGMR